jgi:hypothetical protein
MQTRLLTRVVVTGLVACLIAVIVSIGTPSLVWVWIVSWAALYWFWTRWNHWRGSGDAEVPKHVTAAVVPNRQGRTDGARRPLWRAVVRKTAKLAAGTVGLIVLGVVVMTLYLGYCERQAKAERNKVQIGMTVDDVLPLVHGAAGMRAHAVLPDNMSDEEGVHYATLVEHPDGTFGSYGEPRLTEDQAVALMKQKMSDGYEWRWRYTFVNDTPQHFSFTVTFGRDGHVKDITDVWGWD